MTPKVEFVTMFSINNRYSFNNLFPSKNHLMRISSSFAVRTMSYMQFKQTNPLIGLTQQIRYILKPRRSLKKMMARRLTNKRNPTRPLRVERHLNIEYGWNLEPRSTNHWLSRQWFSWFNSRIVIIASVFTMLPLLWWFSSSNASIESLPSQSFMLKQVHKLDLSASTTVSVSPPLPTNSAPEAKPASFVENIKVVDEITPKTPSLPWLHHRVKSGENLSRIFKEHHFNKKQLRQILQLDGYAEYLTKLQIDQELHIKHHQNGKIEDIILVLNDMEELHVYQEDDKFYGEIRRIGMRSETVVVHGIVETSLKQVATQVGLSSALLDKFIDLFQGLVDFEHDIQIGDKFSLVYEQHQFEGDVEEGHILTAQLTSQGKVYRAVRYVDQTGYVDYYTPMGDSLQKVPLLRVPVSEITRVSSPFGTRRHPILGRYKLHTGVDYAAPWGTPVFAAGDAVVKFVGRKGGYGKTLILEHHKRVMTLYAHLAKYVEEIQVGDVVKQGQMIAYVGQSGRATGPHLHFEIQLDEIPLNPEQVELPLSMPIAEENQAHFIYKTQKLIAKLDKLDKFTKPTRIVQKNHGPLTPAMARLGLKIPVKSLLREYSLASATR
jgi:murein DD-endopeptidase MepM/ murein hydrolase activator NlpD